MSDKNQIAERNAGQVANASKEQGARVSPLTAAVDIIENEHGILLLADLPGVDKSGLEIKVHDGNLDIQAHATLRAPANLTLHHAEIREPHYARSFTLSADLDTSKVEANLQNGVLKLMIPRKEEARPRRIEITG